MKKTTYLYLLILVALAVFSVYILSQNRSGTIPQALKDFAVTDTQNVTKIFMADRSGNRILLERKSASQWQVNNKFIAFKPHIDILLETIKLVEVKNPISGKAKENYLKEMLIGCTKIEIYKKGLTEPAKVYSVGGSTPDNLGTIMLLKGSTDPYITWIPGFDGYLSTRYFTSEKEWRNRYIYTFPATSIKEVECNYNKHPEESFHFTSEGMKFTIASLAKPENIKEVKPNIAKSFLIGIPALEYESFYDVKGKELDSLLALIPTLTISLKAEGTNAPSMKLYPFLAEGHLAMTGKDPIDHSRLLAILSSNPKEVLIIQTRVLDRILRTYSEMTK